MTGGASDRLIGVALVLPLAVALCFSGFRFAEEADDVPGDHSYEAARVQCERWGFSLPHDAVTVLPAWSLRPHRFLRGLEPMSGDRLAERPLDRIARLFVLVEPDGEDDFAVLLERLGPPGDQQQIDNVTLYRFDLNGPYVTHDFSATLAEAEVHIERTGGEMTPCDVPTRGGVACAGAPSWQRVTREHLLVTENSQRVVWAHPPPAGDMLVLRWGETPPAQELVFTAGFTRRGADSATAPVDVEFRAAGKKLGTLRFPPQFAFTTHRLALPIEATRGGEFEIRIHTENNDKSHWAFDAFLSRGGAR